LDKGNKSTQYEELEAWLQTSLITGVTALIVLFVQNFAGRIFNPAFEICIIYVPMLVSLVIYMKLRISARKPSH